MNCRDKGWRSVVLLLWGDVGIKYDIFWGSRIFKMKKIKERVD